MVKGFEQMHNIKDVNEMKGVDKSKFKHIIVSEAVYLKLKGLGGAGDSFNDVLARLLKKLDVPDRSDMK